MRILILLTEERGNTVIGVLDSIGGDCRPCSAAPYCTPWRLSFASKHAITRFPRVFVLESTSPPTVTGTTYSDSSGAILMHTVLAEHRRRSQRKIQRVGRAVLKESSFSYVPNPGYLIGMPACSLVLCFRTGLFASLQLDPKAIAQSLFAQISQQFLDHQMLIQALQVHRSINSWDLIQPTGFCCVRELYRYLSFVPSFAYALMVTLSQQ